MCCCCNCNPHSVLPLCMPPHVLLLQLQASLDACGGDVFSTVDLLLQQQVRAYVLGHTR